MSTKQIKAGLSKANVNAIAGAIGTATLNRLVPQFSTSVSYTKGQYTNYNNQLYRFTSDKSAGAWDSSKVESASLNDLINDVNSAVASVTGKANTQDLLNGTLVPSKALTAEQIENVGEDVGSTQDEPFIFQATATDNGADSVETAPVAKHLKKLGNSIVVNQLVKNPDFTTATNWANASGDYGTLSISNNVATWTCTAKPSQYYQTGMLGNDNYMSIPYNHKVLAIARVKCSIQAGISIYGLIQNEHSYYVSKTIQANTWTYIFGFISDRPTADKIISKPKVCFAPESTNSIEIGTTLECDECRFIDLTQWFGSNDLIPQDLLDHPENAGRYGMLGLAYNVGTLTNCNGQYLESIGRNQWDEEWELGGYSTSTGLPASGTSTIRSKNANPIKVIPNSTYNVKVGNSGMYSYFFYYDKDMNFISYETRITNDVNYGKFTTPSNCCFVKFYVADSYGTTYKNDITISLYYSDGIDYDKYFAFTKNTYDTGTEVLRSAGSVKDIKLPSGEITRKIKSIDLSQQTFSTTTAGGNTIYYLVLSDKADGMVNMLSPNYEPVNATLSNMPNNSMRGESIGKAIYIRCDGTTPSGTLYYELATPTTEQGTAFPENIEVDNYGSMGWLDSNGYVDIPQGSEFFYPADYVEFIDSLYTRSKDGGDSADVSNIVVKSELQSVQNILNTRIPALPSDSENGTYTLKATMSDGTITYEWVAD